MAKTSSLINNRIKILGNVKHRPWIPVGRPQKAMWVWCYTIARCWEAAIVFSNPGTHLDVGMRAVSGLLKECMVPMNEHNMLFRCGYEGSVRTDEGVHGTNE